MMVLWQIKQTIVTTENRLDSDVYNNIHGHTENKTDKKVHIRIFTKEKMIISIKAINCTVNIGDDRDDNM